MYFRALAPSLAVIYKENPAYSRPPKGQEPLQIVLMLGKFITSWEHRLTKPKLYFILSRSNLFAFALNQFQSVA